MVYALKLQNMESKGQFLYFNMPLYHQILLRNKDSCILLILINKMKVGFLKESNFLLFTKVLPTQFQYMNIKSRRVMVQSS